MKGFIWGLLYAFIWKVLKNVAIMDWYYCENKENNYATNNYGNQCILSIKWK